MIGHRSRIWNSGARGRFARALATCSVALWLAGSLSVAQGNLMPQWTQPHCPQGQTHGAQHSHHHCVWYCGGIDAQGTSQRGGNSVDGPSLRVWSLGVIPFQDADSANDFPPRGPPHRLSVI